MRIRLLEKTDIKNAAKIVRLNYSKEYEVSATRELKEMFKKSEARPTYFVAEEKGSIIGFIGYSQSWMDYNIYEIFWVNVLPERQRQGVGVRLVERVIAEIKRIPTACSILLTANNKKGNVSYYKSKFGFKSVYRFQEERHYHLMTLTLK